MLKKMKNKNLKKLTILEQVRRSTKRISVLQTHKWSTLRALERFAPLIRASVVASGKGHHHHFREGDSPQRFNEQVPID